MKELCAICKTKISKFTKNQIGDGYLCGMCNRICQNSPLVSTEDVAAAWEENHRRFQEFEEFMIVKDFGSGFIFIDNTHQYAYISNQKKTRIEPIIFRFSEIEEYRIEKVGEKTITKSKGGIRRAVVGGALFGGVGAIVGANTAKTETKTTGGTPFLYIDLDFSGVKTTVYIMNPPMRASQILDNMMNL